MSKRGAHQGQQQQGQPRGGQQVAYVWEERERIEKAKRVILAVDNDEAGEALAEELARRVAGQSVGE